MSLFCRHQWSVLVETTTESPFENATRCVTAMGDSSKVSIPGQMSWTDRKHIVLLACDKCGKVQKHVEVLQ